MAEKPYLAAAFLCEKVLREKDEVLSVVRIVDTYFVTLPRNLSEDAVPVIQITALLAFKSASQPIGEPEKHQVVVQLHYPSGQMHQKPATLDVFFKQDDSVAGANVVVVMNVGVKEFGRLWLDVIVDGELMTRIPFRVLLKQEEKPTMIH